MPFETAGLTVYIIKGRKLYFWSKFTDQESCNYY